MLWLDSTYPVHKTGPGNERGACATTSGVPSDVETKNADAQGILSLDNALSTLAINTSSSHILEHQIWANWLNSIRKVVRSQKSGQVRSGRVSTQYAVN